MMQQKIEPGNSPEDALWWAMLAFAQVYGVEAAKRARGALKSGITWMEAGIAIRPGDPSDLRAELEAVLPRLCESCPLSVATT
jgi:hypothetical protein